MKSATLTTINLLIYGLATISHKPIKFSFIGLAIISINVNLVDIKDD